MYYVTTGSRFDDQWRLVVVVARGANAVGVRAAAVATGAELCVFVNSRPLRSFQETMERAREEEEEEEEEEGEEEEGGHMCRC